MKVFRGCQITLELDHTVKFKEKLELKKKVTENGGIISFIVTNKVLSNTQVYLGTLTLAARVSSHFLVSLVHSKK